MKFLNFFIPTFILSIFTTIAQARAKTVENYSDAFLTPVNIMLNVFIATSVIVGLGLFLSGIVKAKRYRMNPHEVTLGTVISYLFFGFLLLILPFAVQYVIYGKI